VDQTATKFDPPSIRNKQEQSERGKENKTIQRDGDLFDLSVGERATSFATTIESLRRFMRSGEMPFAEVTILDKLYLRPRLSSSPLRDPVSSTVDRSERTVTRVESWREERRDERGL
jgi:hypothetical protein